MQRSEDASHLQHFDECCDVIEDELRTRMGLPDGAQVPGLVFNAVQSNSTLEDTRIKVSLPPDSSHYKALCNALARKGAELSDPIARNNKLEAWLKVYRVHDRMTDFKIWLAMSVGTICVLYAVYQFVMQHEANIRTFVG